MTFQAFTTFLDEPRNNKKCRNGVCPPPTTPSVKYKPNEEGKGKITTG